MNPLGNLTPEHLGMLAGGALFPIAVGLGSSFTHCAGMCGPIHFFLASKGGFGKSIWLYHAGRIGGYAVMGALMGWAGYAFGSLSSPTARYAAGAILALLYFLFGLGLLGRIPPRFGLERRLGALFPSRWLGRLSANGGGRALLLPAGLAASLLPCPSTHAVLLWALSLHSAVKAAAAMAALGIATLPVFAVLSHAPAFRSAFTGKAYRYCLGAIFLGLCAWRLYALATRGTPSCH